MKAKKENKVYTIDEPQKQRYLNEGYDIYGDNEELLEHSPLKLIKYSEYDKLLKEKKALEEKIAKMNLEGAKATAAETKKKATAAKETKEEGE